MGLTSLPDQQQKRLTSVAKNRGGGGRSKGPEPSYLAKDLTWLNDSFNYRPCYPASCAIAHGTDLRFQISDLMANRSNAFWGPWMLAYHLAIVLVVLLGFAHYGQKPVGRVTPPLFPPPPLSCLVM